MASPAARRDRFRAVSCAGCSRASIVPPPLLLTCNCGYSYSSTLRMSAEGSSFIGASVDVGLVPAELEPEYGTRVPIGASSCRHTAAEDDDRGTSTCAARES